MYRSKLAKNIIILYFFILFYFLYPLQSFDNVISTLVAQNPDVILPSIISFVVDALDDPELLKISRDEYFTFLTPEGELYDKSIIPG